MGRAAPRRLVRAALISCADHELNVSAFTARCVASAGRLPYGVVDRRAGGARRHATRRRDARASKRAGTTLRRARDLRGALADRLRRGEAIEGFGHPLYAARRPARRRAARLLPNATKAAGVRARVRGGRASDVLGEAPNVDFALVAVARALGLPDGAALTLFAIGRTIGWIAHALEQYRKDSIIRPRARYVGPQPGG